jgi:hypothetical protein
MSQGLEDVSGLLELAVEADDEETFNEAVAELDVLEEKLAQLEFRRMFSGEYDSADCYLDIQAGSGGTEAQDWASMLTRMYLRWAKRAASKPKSSKSLKVKWRVLNPSPSRSSAITPTAGCVPKPAFTAWCVRARSTPAAVVIPPSAPRLFTRKWMTISISKSTRRTCVLTFIAHPARVVSTLTVRNLRCVLPTFHRAGNAVPERPFPA